MKPTRHPLLLTILLCVAASLWTFASSLSTRFSSTVNAITVSISDYSKDHKGKLPQTIYELYGRYLNQNKVEETIGGPVTNFFQYYPDEKLVIAEENDSALLLVSSQPIADPRYSGGEIRYVILKAKDGRITNNHYPDDSVRKWFSDAGQKVPDGPVQAVEIPEKFLANASDVDTNKSMPNPADRAARLARHRVVVESNSNASVSLHSGNSLGTNIVLATTIAAPEPMRWWLPVAVFGGLGVIGFLILRARRRDRAP